MHYWKRPEEPEELAEHREARTQKWKDDRVRLGSAAKITWPEVLDDQRKAEKLHERFRRITDNHCAYCDSHVTPASDDTIDHFHPKSLPEFYGEAYAWENLYYCCRGCQKKQMDWHPEVLRPDGGSYAFHRYFRYTREGEIKVVAADPADCARATKTIEVLRLDREELNNHRALIFSQYAVPRQRPLPKPMDPATTSRLLAHRGPDNVTLRPYRDWYLPISGTACWCSGCVSKRLED